MSADKTLLYEPIDYELIDNVKHRYQTIAEPQLDFWSVQEDALESSPLLPTQVGTAQIGAAQIGTTQVDKKSIGFKIDRLPKSLQAKFSQLYSDANGTATGYLPPNQVYLGDARDRLQEIEPNSISVSVWSPPLLCRQRV